MKLSPLVDQFRQAVIKLVPDFPDSSKKLGLAVSGGPDSLALLLLAHHCFEGRVSAATVDHGLRQESRSEAEFVARICAERNIPHKILTPSIPIRGSIQAAARKARYELLNGWMETEKIAYLATAHHADDQLETLIMRVLRGSGIDGMSGVRARRGHIIRPLLHMSKQSLVQYVEENGIAPIDDPSNRDQSFDRVRVRNALKHLEGFDIGLASRSAEALDDARIAISWMVEKLAEECVTKTGKGCELHVADIPHEIERRLLLKCLHICDPALSPRGDQLEMCIIALKQGEKTMLGDVICKGGEKWQFSRAPARKH